MRPRTRSPSARRRGVHCSVCDVASRAPRSSHTVCQMPVVRRIPDRMRLQLPILLAARLGQILRVVFCADDDRLLPSTTQQLGNVGAERRVSAFVLRGQLIVHPDGRQVIDGAEMQDQPLSRLQLRCPERTSIPAGAKQPRLIHTARRSFRGERNNDLAGKSTRGSHYYVHLRNRSRTARFHPNWSSSPARVADADTRAAALRCLGPGCGSFAGTVPDRRIICLHSVENRFTATGPIGRLTNFCGFSAIRSIGTGSVVDF